MVAGLPRPKFWKLGYLWYAIRKGGAETMSETEMASGCSANRAENYGNVLGLSRRELWESGVNGKLAQVLARLEILDKKVFASDQSGESMTQEIERLRSENFEMSATIADLREKLEVQKAIQVQVQVQVLKDAHLGALVRQMPSHCEFIRAGQIYTTSCRESSEEYERWSRNFLDAWREEKR